MPSSLCETPWLILSHHLPANTEQLALPQALRTTVVVLTPLGPSFWSSHPAGGASGSVRSLLLLHQRYQRSGWPRQNSKDHRSPIR